MRQHQLSFICRHRHSARPVRKSYEHDRDGPDLTGCGGEAWGSVHARFGNVATTTSAMAGPNLHKLHSFPELRAVFGSLWVRCNRCRWFRFLRTTSETGHLDWRMTRFKCGRCDGPGYRVAERSNSERGMEDCEDACSSIASSRSAAGRPAEPSNAMATSGKTGPSVELLGACLDALLAGASAYDADDIAQAVATRSRLSSRNAWQCPVQQCGRSRRTGTEERRSIVK